MRFNGKNDIFQYSRYFSRCAFVPQVEDDKGPENAEEVLEILAEWAADEAHAEEARGRPGVFAEEEQPPNVDGLPRLRGKQPPSRGWEHVPIPDWVRQAQHAQSSEEEEAEDPGASGHEDAAGVEQDAADGPASAAEQPACKRAVQPSALASLRRGLVCFHGRRDPSAVLPGWQRTSSTACSVTRLPLQQQPQTNMANGT